METDTASISTASGKAREEWLSLLGRLVAALLLFGPVLLAAMGQPATPLPGAPMCAAVSGTKAGEPSLSCRR